MNLATQVGSCKENSNSSARIISGTVQWCGSSTFAAAAASKPQPATFRSEIEAFAARYQAAKERAQRATTLEDREAAEWERLEAEGDFWLIQTNIVDLFLMMFRFAVQHEPAAVAGYVKKVLRAELDALADGIANLEGRK
jgi:hypothetical protein